MRNRQARVVGMPDRYTLIVEVESDQPPSVVRFGDGAEREIRRQSQTILLLLPVPHKVTIGDSILVASN